MSLQTFEGGRHLNAPHRSLAVPDSVVPVGKAKLTRKLKVIEKQDTVLSRIRRTHMHNARHGA